MGGLADPRKNFRWALEIDGANQFEFQDIETPEVSYTQNNHGAPVNIPDAKSPGKMVVGDIILHKLKPALTADTWAWDWFGKGLTGIKVDFQKQAFLKDLNPAGVGSIETYVLGNIWPKSIKDDNRMTKAEDSDNLIQTVTFACQLYFSKDSPEIAALLAAEGAIAGGLAFLLGFNQS